MIVEDSSCAPPRVWSAGSGGEFAKINRPIAGPTHEKALPDGKHSPQRPWG